MKQPANAHVTTDIQHGAIAQFRPKPQSTDEASAGGLELIGAV
jgi:hypothetical protein